MRERELEPKESKEKCYNFKATVTAVMSGYVWAESPEEAEALIDKMEWEEAYCDSIVEVLDSEFEEDK